ncbi:TraB/GumN family protein [Mangrovivirga sp. M17]|uniref:TraB/GumN family protein n=1 Tax=Mangrovivirga halotolerans TaxID=2993936 RepID=A0ABT3RTG5_9BACT|nr:TraB/GumN family protein [Mangrovivirga halotolerans]MCX2745076.1 TraB/GumN family protein [Mangrovivirga halotolerans]
MYLLLKKWMGKFCFYILIIFFIGLPGILSGQENSSLLWRIEHPDTDKISYLYGTLHLLDKSYIDSLPAVTDALTRAELIVGETLTDSTDLLRKVIKYTLMQDTLLSDIMDSVKFKKLNTLLKENLGVSVLYLNQFKPAMAWSMFTQAIYVQEFPVLAEKNDVLIDQYFLDYAKQNNIELAGLETTSFQMNLLFNKISVLRQLEILEDAVDNIDENKVLLNLMMQNYFANKLESIEADLMSNGLSEDEKNMLLRDRNREWLNKIPALIKDKNSFIAVGAGHLVGEEGLISGLRKLGFKVAPVDMSRSLNN